MRIPLETLIDGILHTLEHEVLPHVETAFARGQLYAALDLLANLRDRIEERCTLHAADADAAVEALRALGAGDAIARAPAEPPAARAAALRQAVVEAMASGAPGVEEALRGYLVGQVVRDVLPLKRSRLGDIAKG
jgi:hypothetical protein